MLCFYHNKLEYLIFLQHRFINNMRLFKLFVIEFANLIILNILNKNVCFKILLINSLNLYYYILNFYLTYAGTISILISIFSI